MQNKNKNTATITAFVPGNISCFFKPYPQKNPRWSGSYGLGFTVNEGVKVTVSMARKTEIFFNEKKIDLPTVSFVINKLTKNPVHISITSQLPLGSGFGLSGASALATAYALNKLLKLGKTKKQLAVLAHTADAFEKTGLGDVVNQYFGGFLLKTQPSSKFQAEKFSTTNIPIYWYSFGTLLTKGVLSSKDLLETIDKSADRALMAIEHLRKLNGITLAEILDISYEFVKTSRLLRDERTSEMIEKIRADGGHASMIVVGNAVMSDASFPGSKKLMISDTAAHVIAD
ncbi:MAG: hypothetical protein HYV40_02085 [Candidatus Levybacteria bacterium]|nr:hypothetical protein [Candidatus Levybacteria bacterium]